MASSPKPPDPYAQAAAQQGAETGAVRTGAIVNNPNVVNPYGSQSTSIAGYEYVPDAQGHMQAVPRYTQTTKLSPDQQRLLGLETQTKGNIGKMAVQQSAKVGDLLKTNLTAEGLTPWANYTADAGLRRDEGPTDRRAIEEAMMGRYRENAAKSASAEDAQLAARGLNPGSARYGGVADTRARAATDASQQAYLASGAESRAAQEAYNQAAQQAWANQQQYADSSNQLRGTQLQERAYLRQTPINEVMALMSGGQATLPTFQPFARQGVNAAPVGQYIGQNYQAQAQQAAQQNAGMFGLAGSVLGGIGGAGGFSNFFK